MSRGRKCQATIEQNKRSDDLGAFLNGEADTSEDALIPPTPGKAKAAQRTEEEKTEQAKTIQIEAMRLLQADRDRKQEEAAAAAVILKQQSASAKTTTGKENDVGASVSRQPPPNARGGEGRAPLCDVETHPNTNTTKGVDGVSYGALVAFVEPYGSPKSNLSSTPSATNSSSSGGVGILLPRKGVHDRSAALKSNLAREEMAGVAKQLCSSKKINPIIPLKYQDTALCVFRTELTRQYERFNGESGSALRVWLQGWLTSQRKQAKHNRTKVINGKTVHLPPKYQEESAAYQAEKKIANPVERLTASSVEGTGSGEPSRVHVAPPTTPIPVSQLLTEDTDTIEPRVLTQEEVVDYQVGDLCGLAKDKYQDNGKSVRAYNSFIAYFTVRSFLLYIFRCMYISKRINTNQRTLCLQQAPYAYVTHILGTYAIK